MNSNKKDLYDIMGISKDATNEEINRAWKRKSIQYHPDKYKESDANEKFSEIKEAFDILSDPTKRDMYDKFGLEYVEQHNKRKTEDMGVFPFPGMNPFARMNGESNAYEKKTIALTLEEIFTKESISFIHPRTLKCDKCIGTGFKDCKAHLCISCKGEGFIIRLIRNGFMQHAQQIPCNDCNGTGKELLSNNLKCDTCGGKSLITRNDNIVVPMPHNILSEQMVRVKSQGSWKNSTFQDIIVTFQVNLSKDYGIIKDKYLKYNISISLAESICGFEHKFNHPSGKIISFVSNPGNIIQPQTIYEIPDLGFGSNPLIITFDISYPDDIIIPNTKKVAFTFKNLNIILSGKYDNELHPEENDLTDTNITPNLIIVTSSLKKYTLKEYLINQKNETEINVNKSIHEEDSMEHGMGEPIQCTQQ